MMIHRYKRTNVLYRAFRTDNVVVTIHTLNEERE